MRWIPFILVAYVVILLQSSLGRMLTFVFQIGAIGPDLAASLAVFVALRARSGLDAMLAAWVLGLALDLATGGGPGSSTVVGPMSLAYALTAGMVFRIREALFRERALTQATVTLLFCLISHGLWVTMQSVRLGEIGWHDYMGLLGQVALVSIYTALLAPLMHYLLSRVERLIVVPATRGRG